MLFLSPPGVVRVLGSVIPARSAAIAENKVLAQSQVVTEDIVLDLFTQHIFEDLIRIYNIYFESSEVVLGGCLDSYTRKTPCLALRIENHHKIIRCIFP